VDTPPNSGSLSEFASRLPSHLFDRRVFALWDGEKDIEPHTPEEDQRLAQDILSRIGGLDPYSLSSSIGSFWLEEGPEGSATEDRAEEEEGFVSPATPSSLYGEIREHWSVEEIVQSSRAGQASLVVGDWIQALPPVIPAGQTYELLVQSGLLAVVEAVLIENGHIDLNAIASQGIDANFPEFLLDEIRSRMEGGNIEHRLRDVRNYIAQDLEAAAAGRKELFIPNSITPEELQRCEELVDEVLASVTSNHKPNREELLSVLHFLVIKSKHQRVFRMTQDYAIRRLGWIDEETPRESKEAKAARDRLLGRMSWFWENAKNCKLPLIRRLEKGYQLPGNPGKPSTYEMLWENWGGPFAKLASTLPLAA